MVGNENEEKRGVCKCIIRQWKRLSSPIPNAYPIQVEDTLISS
jgi:hypothetical protein